VTRAAARFLGLLTLWAGVELLERVAYRAGVDDAAAEAQVALTLVELHVAEDLADEQRRRLCLGDCCQAST
jgi:hypothetical protein